METTPEGDPIATRNYGIAFRDVWNALEETLRNSPRWIVHDADPQSGRLRFTTVNALGYLPLEFATSLRLDELGQTVLEIRCETSENLLRTRAAMARTRTLLRRLERSLGLGGRR